MDEFSLTGRVALITGSGRGIGAEIARTFARAGAAVAVTARTAADIEAVAKEIEASGGKAVAIQADVGDLGDLPGLVTGTVAELGGLDLVVGIHPGAIETAFIRQFLDNGPAELREALIERTRLRRNGAPKDIAAAAVYLAAPAASWVTGSMLDVNGGAVDEYRCKFPDL